MRERIAGKLARFVLGREEQDNSFLLFDFIRAVLRKVPRKYHNEITETLKECLSDAGRLQEYAVQLDDRGLSRAADTIHLFHPGLMNFRSAPPKFWKKVRIINLLELVHEELKRH